MSQDVSSLVESLVDRVVRERFGDVIHTVRVTEDNDFDGDPVFIVNVVFNGPGPLDDTLTTGVSSHIRRRLREERDERFPIISYTSRSDAGLSSEAA